MQKKLWFDSLCTAADNALFHMTRNAQGSGCIKPGPNPKLSIGASTICGDCTDVVGTASKYLCGNCSEIWGDITGLLGDCSDLSGDCAGLKGDCSGLHGNVTCLYGDCSDLVGDCSEVIGCVTGITGRCTRIHGNLDDCKLLPEEISGGIDIRLLCHNVVQRNVASGRCPNCGGTMVGDGYTMVEHCENIGIHQYDAVMCTEPDAPPIYCEE